MTALTENGIQRLTLTNEFDGGRFQPILQVVQVKAVQASANSTVPDQRKRYRVSVSLVLIF